jgi:hypothetical protein
MPKGRVLILSGFVVAAAMVVIVLPSANSSNAPLAAEESRFSPAIGKPIPNYALKAVGGRIGRRATWSVWLFGRRADNCWATKTTTRGIPYEEAFCGYNVPPDYWQLAASGEVGGGRSMAFYLTRKDVGRVTAHVRQGKGRPDKRVSMKTRSISAEQARRAHLHANFSYATTNFSGSLFCVKRVEVFDHFGRQVEEKRLKCIPPSDPVKENFE